jgi:hypothetical protein
MSANKPTITKSKPNIKKPKPIKPKALYGLKAPAIK